MIINVSFNRENMAEGYSYVYEGKVVPQIGDIILNVPARGRLTTVYVTGVDIPVESLAIPIEKLAKITEFSEIFRKVEGVGIPPADWDPHEGVSTILNRNTGGLDIDAKQGIVRR